MALSIGIVGLPNVGKSTLFNALTKAQNAQAANYPFCTIEPNKATVPVPDRRIDALVDLVHPQKTINATVDFIDIAGLVRGASKGEGLGNQFLGNIRECAAILEVVRCFEDDDITHVDGSVDPLRDIETIETELLLADIQGTSKRHERMVKMSKGDKDARVAADEMARLLEHLNNGNPASTFEAKDCPAFAAAWHELGLLTAKKIIYCANVDEDSLAEDNAHVTRLREFAATRNIEVVKICARIEEELQGLSDEEQREMLGAYGIEESGLLRVIHSGYKALGLAQLLHRRRKGSTRVDHSGRLEGSSGRGRHPHGLRARFHPCRSHRLRRLRQVQDRSRLPHRRSPPHRRQRVYRQRRRRDALLVQCVSNRGKGGGTFLKKGFLLPPPPPIPPPPKTFISGLQMRFG